MKKIILGLTILALAGTQVQTAKAFPFFFPPVPGPAIVGAAAAGTAIGIAATHPYYAAPAPYPYYGGPAYYPPGPVVYGPGYGYPYGYWGGPRFYGGWGRGYYGGGFRGGYRGGGRGGFHR